MKGLTSAMVSTREIGTVAIRVEEALGLGSREIWEDCAAATVVAADLTSARAARRSKKPGGDSGGGWGGGAIP